MCNLPIFCAIWVGVIAISIAPLAGLILGALIGSALAPEKRSSVILSGPIAIAVIWHASNILTILNGALSPSPGTTLPLWLPYLAVLPAIALSFKLQPLLSKSFHVVFKDELTATDIEVTKTQTELILSMFCLSLPHQSALLSIPAIIAPMGIFLIFRVFFAHLSDQGRNNSKLLCMVTLLATTVYITQIAATARLQH